jgi:HAE1 family hydrophobic/amphiphilic exporter-1
VLVSLFVSFSLDPMLSAYWPDPELEAHEHRSWISRKLVTFNAWFDRMAQRYTGVIGWALDHRLAMIGLATFSMAGAIWLQANFGGFGFVPVTDNSEFTIQVETPPGSNLEYTRLKAEEAARLARAHPEVRYTFTTIGAGGGMDPSEALGAVDLATVYVRMTARR